MNYLGLSPELFELADALPLLFATVLVIAFAGALLACVSEFRRRN